MPFTPFHLGPGAAFKAVAGQYFSFTVFVIAQIATDVEVLFNIFRGAVSLHTHAHTYVGATVLGAVLAILGKPVGEALLRTWNQNISPQQNEWLFVLPHISWLASISGAFVGTYSHVFLDSIMHVDMRPWAPFHHDNAWLATLSLEQLHRLCFGLGICGGILLYVKNRKRHSS